VSAEVHHPLFARMYARMSARAEAGGPAEHRRELLRDLTGRVIEVGAGNGLNFAHYPPAVHEVVAVEPEAHLRMLAVEAVHDANVPVQVIDGVAEQLPAEDQSFDAAVASLVLCTVKDQDAALEELYRVIRPGGELRFYEHVVATKVGLKRFQRLRFPFTPMPFPPKIPHIMGVARRP
jgi:ubiquinone/menaquinone biosynthesis C-methylase UbiE